MNSEVESQNMRIESEHWRYSSCYNQDLPGEKNMNPLHLV